MFLGLVSVALLGLCPNCQAHSRLTPWAAFLRRFGAGFGSCSSQAVLRLNDD
jgi:hypothetical protein